jgi:hypothetical protein
MRVRMPAKARSRCPISAEPDRGEAIGAVGELAQRRGQRADRPEAREHERNHDQKQRQRDQHDLGAGAPGLDIGVDDMARTADRHRRHAARVDVEHLGRAREQAPEAGQLILWGATANADGSGLARGDYPGERGVEHFALDRRRRRFHELGEHPEPQRGH